MRTKFYFLTFSLLVLLLSSCVLGSIENPPVRTTPRRAKTGLPPVPYAAVLSPDQAGAVAQARSLVKIKVIDRGRSRDCEYPEVLDRARNKAMSLGGNVLLVTEHRLPSQTGSSCSRIRAEVFVVPSLEGLEREIRWDKSRRLLPGDLRGKPGSAALPPVRCTLKYRLLGDFFTHINVRTQTLFLTDSTWRPEAGALYLRRAQLHFDLAEISARGFKSELTALAPNLKAMTGQAKSLLQKYQAEYQRRAAEFDAAWEQTGLSETVLAEWEYMVRAELTVSADHAGDVKVSLLKGDK